VIKYLGSKRTLIPRILEAVRSAGGGSTVADLFSGTSRVGHALKRAGYRVLANDHNAYAATLARCYVQADDILAPAAQRIIDECNALPGSPGYFTETFCVRSRFIQPHNGERIDAIREWIARRGLEPELESVVLVSLMEAADRVDSTTGVQMAYLKSWAARSHAQLRMRLPGLLPRSPLGKGEAHQLDALDAARSLEADVAYIDPPYNQHSYLGNYHVWETLVRWDKPGVYGIACKREDVRRRQSPFNSRQRFLRAFQEVIDAARAPVLVVSFSNEGYLGLDQVVALLRARGPVRGIEMDYKRYVGAQIGIYNPSGEKVGKISHLRNKEYLFVVGGEASEEPLPAPAVQGVGEGVMLDEGVRSAPERS
jgi:adenine-specific DNA-methyltransferase